MELGIMVGFNQKKIPQEFRGFSSFNYLDLGGADGLEDVLEGAGDDAPLGRWLPHALTWREFNDDFSSRTYFSSSRSMKSLAFHS